MAKQVYSAWGTAVRQAWEVPRGTREYIVKSLLSPDTTYARVDILSRYVGIVQGLRKSPSKEVRFMANIVSRDLCSSITNYQTTQR